MRPMTWKSKDGLDVEGLLWLPASYKTGDKLPLILSIHGGPAGVWSTSFRGINHVYTSLGWAVLEPNVRGSTSYGDALLRGNMKDIGGGDYQDAMTGVDAVIAQGIADPESARGARLELRRHSRRLDDHADHALQGGVARRDGCGLGVGVRDGLQPRRPSLVHRRHAVGQPRGLSPASRRTPTSTRSRRRRCSCTANRTTPARSARA